MDSAAFTRMQKAESSWWYRGRRRIVENALKRAGVREVEQALDFGAGYGAMRDIFRPFSKSVAAYEPEGSANAQLHSRQYERTYSGASAALAHRYGLVGMFDVLEHIKDDAGQLRGIGDALDIGGYLVITVPAYMFLWSRHDTENRHFRRYTRQTLRNVLIESGYRVEFISYWNSILFPAALLTRLMNRSGESAFSLPRVIDSVLYACILLESGILRFASLPFGVSLVAVARKI